MTQQNIKLEEALQGLLFPRLYALRTAAQTGSIAPSSGTTIETSTATSIFIYILIVFIISWILVSFWGKVLDNLAFRTLGLDSHSTYDAFIFALIITTIFIVGIVIFDKYFGNPVSSEGGQYQVSSNLPRTMSTLS